ncbi:hypothetical protein B0H13DRAFT_1948043 [Mycena leptocephala]|nr:hypothetical protein B0H13DRAFT_1948043 [Mycena leptocephala]
MMGMAYAFGDSHYVKGDLESHPDDFFDVFEGYSNTIGIAEQSCQICYWLSEELLLSNEDFNLPGSHGRTVPWSPPRFGIPLSILSNLEAELLELLMDSTQLWLEQKLGRQEENSETGITARSWGSCTL